MYLHWIQLLCFSAYLVSGYRLRKFKFERKCKADMKEPWSFKGRNGPYYWGNIFPTCSGKEQSPINIKTDYVIFDKRLDKLVMHNYDIPVTEGTIENNGRAIQVTVTDGVERGIKVNGKNYILEQFNFHWGSTPYKGAGHTVDGNKMAMELHFVHRNSNNELAVVAVLFKEQKRETEELHYIIDHFPKVMFRDMTFPLKSKLVLSELLPSNPASFFRYPGSLTAPECNEGVNWSVLTEPMPIGFKQIDEFRKLYSTRKSEPRGKCKLSDNVRPVQPLYGRKVVVSK